MAKTNAVRKQRIEAELKALFERTYHISRVTTGMGEREFRRSIERLIGIEDYAMEEFAPEEVDVQYGFHLKSVFGHNHNFGPFEIKGRMGDRHTHVTATFIDMFDLPENYFEGKRVLDVGCWGGGTSLMLLACGAEHVTAIEEVRKQADIAEHLFACFGLQEKTTILKTSLYEQRWAQRFDCIFFPGVLYHLSDPVVGLRILYNALKIDGEILVESAARQMDCIVHGFEDKPAEAFIQYFGPQDGGSNWFVPNKAALRMMMEDVGFEEFDAEHLGDRRIYARAKKLRQVGIRKAGLSVKDL